MKQILSNHRDISVPSSLQRKQRFASFIEEMIVAYGGQKALAEALGYSTGAINRWRGSKGISDTENPLSLDAKTRYIMAASKGWTHSEWVDYIEGVKDSPTQRKLDNLLKNLSLKEIVSAQKMINERLDELVNSNPVYGIHSQLNDRQLFNLRKVLKLSLERDGFLRSGGMDYVAAAATADRASPSLARSLQQILQVQGKAHPGNLQPLTKRGITSLCYVVAKWEDGEPIFRDRKYTEWGKMLRDLDYVNQGIADLPSSRASDSDS